MTTTTRTEDTAADDPVVITGIGAITPLGNTADQTWDCLINGRSGVGPITQFDASTFTTRIAAEVKGFDPAEHLKLKDLKRTSRATQLAVVAAREAVADAGLPESLSDFDGITATSAGASDETRDPAGGAASGGESPDGAAKAGDIAGIVVNAAVSGFPEVEEATRTLDSEGARFVSPMFVPASLTNMPACQIAMDLGVHGPVNASALACASGAYALLEARDLILSGQADVMIAGGTDASITAPMFAGLGAMRALSPGEGDPAEVSRPFDADRTGFVFGEGAVLFVLERLSRARARGAEPYASVLGGALTSDGFHVVAPEPSGRYAAAAITRALNSSCLSGESVDLVVAHGTSTKANDTTETAAIRTAFGAAADDLAVSAPKSMTGHLIGAAGALAAMVCARSIRDCLIPPTINYVTPDPDCDLDYVPNSAREVRVENAITNAFGFGGQNCVAAFGRV
jgi:3-oxoacyl-[acyl-carrier-protein] synthase II